MSCDSSVDQDFDPDFADYSPGENLRTSTFELLPDDAEFEEDDSDTEDEGDDGGDDEIGPRTSVKRTMSRRGAIAHHGSQYMMGTCDAAVFATLRRTDGTEEYERPPPPGTQIRYHYYTSPRKRCRITVEYEDPYDVPEAHAAPPFVDEASNLLESCRLESEENCRGMPRRRTESFMSNVSNHSSSSSSINLSSSFRFDRSAPLADNSFTYERPLTVPQRSSDNAMAVS